MCEVVKMHYLTLFIPSKNSKPSFVVEAILFCYQHDKVFVIR